MAELKLYFVISTILQLLLVSASKYPPRYQQPPTDSKLFTPFPNKLWAYWGSGLDKSMIWVSLCINNMRHYAEISGWQFFFLTDSNYTNFLTPTSRAKIEELFTMNSTYKFTRISKSDLIRVLLLLDNGGMWLDASSFFLGDFSWLQRLYALPYIFNRFFPDPQVLNFCSSRSVGGNKTIVWDQKLGRNVNLHPGMESWAMIAKPNSLFYQDIVKNIESSARLGKEESDRKNREAGVRYHNEGHHYFFVANYQYQTVLQRKQKELDAQRGPVKYAVEYYKIWSIESFDAGLTLLNNLDTQHLHQIIFRYSLEDLEEMFEHQILPTFIKMVGWITGQVQDNIGAFYNQPCSRKTAKLGKNSLFYNYLVNISSSSPVNDRMKRYFGLYEGKQFIGCDLLEGPADFVGLLETFMFWLALAVLIYLPFLSNYLSKQSNEFEMIEIDQIPQDYGIQNSSFQSIQQEPASS